MRRNILRVLLYLCLAFALIFGIVGCEFTYNSDTGYTNSDTSTSTQTDTETNTSTNIPTIITYNVTFVLEGETLETQRVVSGGFARDPKPVKVGYHIESWLLDGEPFSLDTPITQSITLTGSWAPNPATVIFNANGGKGKMDDIVTEIKSTVNLTQCSFERVGYTFKGWATSFDGPVFYRDKGKLFTGTDSEYILYAVWEPKTYTLTLDHLNPFKTDNENESFELKTDELFEFTFEPYREYHVFLGWSKIKGGVVAFESDDLLKMEPNNMTLYAVWDVEPPKNEAITLVSNKTSEYSIVYTDGNSGEKAVAEALATHIKEKYGVELPCYASTYTRKDKEIIIGGAREQAYVVSKGIQPVNDFTIAVSGNDLVLYATSEHLLEYMLDFSRNEIFDGKQTSFAKTFGFTYSLSEYKDMPYAGYYKEITGTYNLDMLLHIFKAQSFTASDGTVIPYRIYIPSSYDPENPPPVLTLLHGAGERGTDNISQLKNMLPQMMNQIDSKYQNAIIIAPQCPLYNADGTEARWVDWDWEKGNYSTKEIPESNELKAVHELLFGLNNAMATDTSRYYITGLSMGGFGAWDMLARHSEMFAAGLVLCGGGDPEMASTLKDIPICVAHSTDDGSVPFRATREMVDAITEAGGKVLKFYELRGFGHIIWDDIGMEDDIANWLFYQSKE